MIFASNNEGKLREIRKIFSDVEIKSLKDANIAIDVDEDQDTFYGNAKKKAYEIYNISHEAVLADDSGLCIEALDDFPGVLTHRFMGEVSDEVRNNEFIKMLDDKPNRSAKVVCSLVYYDGIKELTSTGIIKGTIAYQRVGTNGFGFDDIFILDSGLSLAQLSSEEKNKVSARSVAAEEMKQKIKRICK